MRRPPDQPTPPRREKGKQRVRFVARDQGAALAAPRRARFPQLHRQAVLHPVRIDDARPAHRRPAGGQQISLWLVLRLSDLPQSGRHLQILVPGRSPWHRPPFHARPPVRQHARARRRRHRHPAGQTNSDYIKRVIGLPGDTLRMDDGQLFINGQPVKRVQRAPDDDSGRHQFAVRVEQGPSASRIRVQGRDGKAYCRLPVVPRDPAQRPQLRHDRRSDVTTRTISGLSPSRPATVFLMGDNRDRLSRQPRAAWRLAASAARCRGRISAAAPSSSPSRSMARPNGGTRSAGSRALRPGRAGRSLRHS